LENIKEDILCNGLNARKCASESEGARGVMTNWFINLKLLNKILFPVVILAAAAGSIAWTAIDRVGTWASTKRLPKPAPPPLRSWALLPASRGRPKNSAAKSPPSSARSVQPESSLDEPLSEISRTSAAEVQLQRLRSFQNYEKKKAAHEGGLSLGRKRPKRRSQHRCCIAKNITIALERKPQSGRADLKPPHVLLSHGTKPTGTAPLRHCAAFSRMAILTSPRAGCFIQIE
jgi:hypothetical protein